MSDQEGKPAASRRKATSGDRPLKVIPGKKQDSAEERKPKAVRVVSEPDEPVTPDKRRELFASNLDRLIGVLGLNRKDAAREAGISYKLMRRLVSAGVSSIGARNHEALKSLASYFDLPGIKHFWRTDLLRWLLTTDDGRGFVQKFHPRLRAEWERRIAGARVVGHEDLVLLGRALGVEGADLPPLTGPYADKVAAILASAKGDTFRRVIDDYYELVRRLASGTDEGRETKVPGVRA